MVEWGRSGENILSNQTPEQLQKIGWMSKPPDVGRRRAAEPTTVVVVAQKAVLCKLLGVGASRVVYALGTDFAIKYEYADPMGRVQSEGSEDRAIFPIDVALDA